MIIFCIVYVLDILFIYNIVDLVSSLFNDKMDMEFPAIKNTRGTTDFDAIIEF